MHMERKEPDKTIFGRVKNRSDLIGRVIRIDDRFVCLDIPDFKGYLEYPIELVEIIENENGLERA